MKKNIFSTIVHFLHWNAIDDPKKHAFRYVNKDGDILAELTYAELDLLAFKAGSYLRTCSERGQRVLILLPGSMDFIASFFGVLYANLIAVPVDLPLKGCIDHRLDFIFRDCQPALLLTTREGLEILQAGNPSIMEDSHLRVLIWEEMMHSGNIFTEYSIGIDIETAYIQYTGCTAEDPRGIPCTHYSILNHLTDIAAEAGLSSKSISMSWLPLSHDMGLVAGILLTVYNGITCWLMSPTGVLNNPISWLSNLSRYKVTHSAAPGFTFDLCLRHLDLGAYDGLNLSSLTYVANCNEPVNAETILEWPKMW